MVPYLLSSCRRYLHRLQVAPVPVYSCLHVRRGVDVAIGSRLTFHSIFKNLTIILIAYGEVFMFSGHVTPLTLVSFALMVSSFNKSALQETPS